MKEHGIYFAKNEFYELIKSCGGQWNDAKIRPIVCLIKSKEYDNIYWAIPLGNYDHRDEAAKARLNVFLNYDKKDIRSCYYHIGNTDQKSIFFISDAIPITDKYIAREYIGKYSQKHYEIKNDTLLRELERKLGRILSMEKNKPNTYRQHITSVLNKLLEINE